MALVLHGSKNFPDNIYNLSCSVGMTHSQLGRIYSFFSGITGSYTGVWIDIENMIPLHHWTCNVNYINRYEFYGVRKIDDKGSFPIPLISSTYNSHDIYYGAENKNGKICNKSVWLNYNNNLYLYSDNSLLYENYPLYSDYGLSFSGFTLSMWIRLSGTTGDLNIERSIIRNTCGQNSPHLFDFKINYGSLYFKMYYGSTGITATYNSPYNQFYLLGMNWIHLVIGIDVKKSKSESTIKGDFFFFVDGITQGRIEYKTGSTIMEPFCEFINVSGREYSQWFVNSGYSHMNIQIEDIRFYTRGLTTHEIGYIYNQGQGTFNQSYCNGFPTIKYPKYWFKTQERILGNGDIMTNNDCINIEGLFASTPIDSVNMLVGKEGIINRFPEHVPHFIDELSYAFHISNSTNSNVGISGYCFNICDDVNSYSNYSFTFWLNPNKVIKDHEIVIVGNIDSIDSIGLGDISIYIDSGLNVYFSYGDGISNYTILLTVVPSDVWSFFAITIKYLPSLAGDVLTVMYNNEFGLLYSTPRDFLITDGVNPVSVFPNQGLYVLYNDNVNNETIMSLQDLRIFNYTIEYDEMINIYNESKGILF